jgi:hypothetical protein
MVSHIFVKKTVEEISTNPAACELPYFHNALALTLKPLGRS